MAPEHSVPHEPIDFPSFCPVFLNQSVAECSSTIRKRCLKIIWYYRVGAITPDLLFDMSSALSTQHGDSDKNKSNVKHIIVTVPPSHLLSHWENSVRVKTDSPDDRSATLSPDFVAWSKDRICSQDRLLVVVSPAAYHDSSISNKGILPMLMIKSRQRIKDTIERFLGAPRVSLARVHQLYETPRTPGRYLICLVDNRHHILWYKYILHYVLKVMTSFSHGKLLCSTIVVLLSACHASSCCRTIDPDLYLCFLT